MAYIGTLQYDSLDFQRITLDEVIIMDVYYDSNQHYWVGFPKVDDGNDSDESLIIENANIPIYDRKSGGSVRFLDSKWIKEHCQNKVIVQLKNNVNRALVIPDYVRKGILQNMTYSQNSHCTHIYKFTCKKIGTKVL